MAAGKQTERNLGSNDAVFKELETFVDKIAEGQKPARVSLLKQIFKTALKLGLESPGTLNLKIATTVIKELRYSFKMFYPDRFVPKVTVFGSARTLPTDPVYHLAKEFGKEAFKRNYMIVTGGGPGVMAAANEGATIKGGFGLNIRLPFEQSANPFIDEEKKLIHYKYFFTRKLFLLKEASALVLFPGGFGTLDEGFEVLTLVQTGKSRIVPIVMVEPPGYNFWGGLLDFIGNHLVDRGFVSAQDRHLYRIVNSANDAMDHIEHFYKSYHSLRLVDDLLVLRLRQAPSATALKEMEKKFGFLSTNGKFKVSGPLAAESNEPELKDLVRLVFPFERRDFSTLRLLIDFINDSAV